MDNNFFKMSCNVFVLISFRLFLATLFSQVLFITFDLLHFLLSMGQRCSDLGELLQIHDIFAVNY